MRLAIKPYTGLEIVIPKKFPQKQIPRILQQHEAWIIKQLQKHHSSLQQVKMPENIHLGLLGIDFPVSYVEGLKPGLADKNSFLVISSPSDEHTLQLLRNWIRQKAKKLLPDMLSQTAKEFDFSYHKVSIRSQKSRWGSCSSSGTISLNDQLLFMPENTVRYLMIHELCHTRFMNHSASFWKLVEKYCPDYKRHDLLLSRGRERVPDWFHHSLFNRS